MRAAGSGICVLRAPPKRASGELRFPLTKDLHGGRPLGSWCDRSSSESQTATVTTSRAASPLDALRPTRTRQPLNVNRNRTRHVRSRKRDQTAVPTAAKKATAKALASRTASPGAFAADTERMIKTADRAAAYLEATRLAGFSPAEAHRFFGPQPYLSPALERDYLTPWPAEKAASRYLERFSKLVAG